jgi:hypothetical protein
MRVEESYPPVGQRPIYTSSSDQALQLVDVVDSRLQTRDEGLYLSLRDLRS